MMRQWRLLYDEPLTGRRNMAVDDAILEAVGRGDQPPTLRLYAWSPACLSLGYGQKETDADGARLEHFGWDLVRRPTGGKAILHTDELTYSVTLPGDHPLAEVDIVESYRRISQALMAALVKLGLTPQADRKDDSVKGAGAVCFEVPSHYEITAGGRKLVGSAQVRRKNGLLQHGTLPLTGDLGHICDALAYADDADRDAARASVYRRAVTLEDALGRAVTWDEAAAAVRDGFREVFAVDLIPGTLSDAEARAADQAERDRYASTARLITRG